ncbi:hypothetical protein OROMI_011926 [Orobanche minor]
MTSADKSFDSCRKRQINKSRPMDEDDSKAIFKLANEEQEQADKAFQILETECCRKILDKLTMPRESMEDKVEKLQP